MFFKGQASGYATGWEARAGGARRRALEGGSGGGEERHEE